MIQYFTIYGERCSGTNFLEKAIKENFELKLVWHYHYKHFFGFYNFEKKNPIIENDDDVLFLSIVRDPVYWINSFYQKKHHIPESNKTSIHAFIKKEFYSVDSDGKEIERDRHLDQKRRYRNIFELRQVKNNYLIHTMKKNVKHYLLIRYEDLNNHYETILKFIQEKFKLRRKTNEWKKIIDYKGQMHKIYVPKKVNLPVGIIKKIWERVDKVQEKSLGYL